MTDSSRPNPVEQPVMNQTGLEWASAMAASDHEGGGKDGSFARTGGCRNVWMRSEAFRRAKCAARFANCRRIAGDRVRVSRPRLKHAQGPARRIGNLTVALGVSISRDRTAEDNRDRVAGR